MADYSGFATSRGEDEVGALARLTFDELARGMGGIGQIHGAIANRVFTRVGARGVVARAAHDAITEGVYAGPCHAVSAARRGATRRLSPPGASDG